MSAQQRKTNRPTVPQDLFHEDHLDVSLDMITSVKLVDESFPRAREVSSQSSHSARKEPKDDPPCNQASVINCGSICRPSASPKLTCDRYVLEKKSSTGSYKIQRSHDFFSPLEIKPVIVDVSIQDTIGEDSRRLLTSYGSSIICQQLASYSHRKPVRGNLPIDALGIACLSHQLYLKET